MMNRGMMNPILYSNDTPQPVGAGIYHSPSLGLISLSSDGETRTTIADKNLGATQVYNDGDELSQANCGNYYQRGNNYGFPFDGSFEKDSTQVDASNYGPYYESDTFIKGNRDWSSVQNDNLWGGGDNVYPNEKSQGPCPEGFHIPSSQYYYGEMWWLNLVMTQIFGTNYAEAAQRYLKTPLAGGLNYTGEQEHAGTVTAILCKNTSDGFAAALALTSNTSQLSYGPKASGANIRPFSNNVYRPDDTRITLYGDKLNSRIAHNPTLGLISLWNINSNRWVTISDKNLGATQVYNYGDELTEANCGKFYQRGNNYGFPFTGPTKTSTIQVDATNYGPYYKSGIFITTNSSTADWSSVHNNNLWGGVVGTNKAKKGPCAEGYHVPSIGEWSSMWSIATGLGISNEGRNLRTYLKMPFMSSTTSSGTVPYVKDRGFYRSSTAGNREGQSYRLWSNDSRVAFDQRVFRSTGNPIRPFKNEPVTPDGTRNKLY